MDIMSSTPVLVFKIVITILCRGRTQFCIIIQHWIRSRSNRTSLFRGLRDNPRSSYNDRITETGELDGRYMQTLSRSHEEDFCQSQLGLKDFSGDKVGYNGFLYQNIHN